MLDIYNAVHGGTVEKVLVEEIQARSKLHCDISTAPFCSLVICIRELVAIGRRLNILHINMGHEDEVAASESAPSLIPANASSAAFISVEFEVFGQVQGTWLFFLRSILLHFFQVLIGSRKRYKWTPHVVLCLRLML